MYSGQILHPGSETLCTAFMPAWASVCSGLELGPVEPVWPLHKMAGPASATAQGTLAADS